MILPIFYDVMVFAHVALFVYWLGPDFGVFVASDYVTRKDTPLEERLRFLGAVVRMAQLSRNCLILLLGVGLWLAADLGASAIDGALLYASLAGVLTWFAISIVMYRTQGTPVSVRLGHIDQGIRYLLIAALPILALISIFGDDGPFYFVWIALKVLLFAFLLVNSIQQRAVAIKWRAALQDLKAGGPEESAQAVFDATLPRARINAYLTWAASLAIAFLGVTKLI